MSYEEPDAARKLAFRRQLARDATAAQPLAIGIEVESEETGVDLGVILTAVADAYTTSLGGVRVFARSELRLRPTEPSCAALLEMRALTFLAGTVARITPTSVRIARVTGDLTVAINVEMSRAEMLVYAARAFAG